MLNRIKDIEKVMSEFYTTIKDSNTMKMNKLIYDIYKENPEDKDFYSEYKAEIISYEKAMIAFEKSKYKKISVRELSNIYEEYKNKKDVLMNDYTNKNTG
ncbi:MAG: hypothetical protein Q4P28_02130 [Tissierellia bacterium]|nr:hypothetical protein [Tissierellia bacterium]